MKAETAHAWMPAVHIPVQDTTHVNMLTIGRVQNMPVVTEVGNTIDWEPFI